MTFILIIDNFDFLCFSKKYYCSICFPKNAAAVSTSFVSTSPNSTSSSFDRIITAPISSPSAMIGAMTWLIYSVS